MAASPAELARAHRKAEMGDCPQWVVLFTTEAITHTEVNCHIPQGGTVGTAVTQRLSPLLLSPSLSDPSTLLGLGHCVSDPGPAKKKKKKVYPTSHCFQSYPLPSLAVAVAFLEQLEAPGFLPLEGLHSILPCSFRSLCRYVSCPGTKVLTFPLAWHVPVALP